MRTSEKLTCRESRTGKESVARTVHKFSHRSPLAIRPRELRDESASPNGSRLFGQQRGSRSPRTQPRPGRFQLAEGGRFFREATKDLSAEAQHAPLLVQEIDREVH